MPKPKFLHTLEYNYKGLPCLIGVYQWEDFHHDWTLCDRKGYKAPWLIRQLSKDDCDTIFEFIYQRLEGD